MDEAVDLIQRHRAFLIASHRDPDGDSLGSSMALALGLDRLDKRSEVIIAQAVPRNLQRFPAADRVRTVDRCPSGFGAAILIESSSFERTGIDGFDGMETLNIDHHASNTRFADVDWIDPEVSATGVMIHSLLRRLEVEITPEIATWLYVTILTDTGSFRFSNTDAETLSLAARLVERGVDPSEVASAVYDGVPATKVRLLGRALESLRLEDDGSVAWMALPWEDFEESGAERETEGIINHAQSIEGVEVSILFKEVEPDGYRVSLRSNGSIDVADLAMGFDGGGHPRAAGFAVDGPFDEVRRRVLDEIRRRRDTARRAGA